MTPILYITFFICDVSAYSEKEIVFKLFLIQVKLVSVFIILYPTNKEGMSNTGDKPLTVKEIEMMNELLNKYNKESQEICDVCLTQLQNSIPAQVQAATGVIASATKGLITAGAITGKESPQVTAGIINAATVIPCNPCYSI